MIKTIAEQDIGVSTTQSKRIMAFDLIRGFFLAMIMVDHIELYPGFFDFFTGKGRLFVSAAEGFFFLSGLLIGLVYKRRLAHGMAFIFKKMWARALELYIVSVALTLFYVWLAVATNHPGIKYGLPSPFDWHWIITHTFTFRYQFGWADFLSRFSILMLIAPFAFWLTAKGKWWLVLAGSIIAWVFRGNNFVLAWQILFIGGVVVGFHWYEITHWFSSLKAARRRMLKRTVITLTTITFGISYASVYVLSLLNQYLASLPHWLQSFTLGWNNFNYDVWIYTQKWTMGPLRIALFLLWASVLYMWVKKHEIRINEKTKGILELLGRNSLYVYFLHSLITFVFKYFIPIKTNFIENFGITFMALLALIYGTKAYSFMRVNWPQFSMTNFYKFISRKSRAIFDSGL